MGSLVPRNKAREVTVVRETGEGERERERDRDTERHRETERETETPPKNLSQTSINQSIHMNPILLVDTNYVCAYTKSSCVIYKHN